MFAYAFLIWIAQERAEQARIRVYAQLQQKQFIELECTRILFDKLIDAIEPLQEHRATFVQVRMVDGMAIALGKLVAKHEPIGFDKRLEACLCPIKRIK